MEINIASGIGTGPTKLAAFDAALIAAGVANYNLIKLSSVIPSKSKIIIHDNGPIKHVPGRWGDRLYVVMAEKRVNTKGVEAWSGIGWVQDKKTQKGLFVEHEGMSKAAVQSDIKKSLKTLMSNRGVDFGPINMQIIGKKCSGSAICSLVVAVYKPEDWNK
jgi:arginine decarboxylase